MIIEYFIAMSGQREKKSERLYGVSRASRRRAGRRRAGRRMQAGSVKQ